MPEPILARVEQLVLMVLVAAGIAGFGAAYGQPPAWIFWLPCLVSIFWRIEKLPNGLRTAARWAAYLVEVFTVLLGLIFNGIGAALAFGILSSPETMGRLTLIAGYGLCFFASLFLMGPKVWPRASAFFPAAIGLLVVDCFNPLAQIRPIVMGAGAALFAFLALPVLQRGLRRVPWTQWARLGVFAGISAGSAAAAIILLPLLQTQVEQTTFQIFMSMGQGYSGLSTTARLGDLEQLKLSNRVALRAWSTRAQDLRARAYSRFDGRAWIASPGTAVPLRVVASPDLPMSKAREWLESVPGSFYAVPGENAPIADPGVVVTRIVPTASTDNLMVAPGNKLLAKGELAAVKVDAQQNLQPPIGGAMGTYAVVNRVGEVVQAGAASAKEIEETLQVPADTDPRFRELAARLSAGAPTVQEKMQRTLALVSRECHYSLEVGKFRSQQPVAEFLFEKKRGYCQYFASAAALLLRLQGVPTRYVSGFHVTENNRVGDHYVVRDLDAHAWIECYLPGQGWMAADPTPAAEYEALHAGIGRGWLASAGEWVKARGSELLLYLRHNDWRSGLRWAWAQCKAGWRFVFQPWTGVVLALIAIIFLVMRRRPRTSKLESGAVAKPRLVGVENAPELALLLRRAEGYWAAMGCERPSYRGPWEHLASIAADRLPPEQRRAAERVVESFYRASFGGVTLSPEEVGELRRASETLVAGPKT